MNPETAIQAISQKLGKLLENEQGYFLVDISIQPTNNIKVFVDADQGVSIDQLTKLNRALYKEMEEGDLFPNGDFSLEVSSPGLGEPLKLHRQYQKNVGRYVDVLLKNGVKLEGKLLAVSEEDILLEEEKGKGKKKELIQHNIIKTEIKTTRVQIRF